MDMVTKDAGEIFSRVLRDSTPRFVGWSVGRSVCWSHFTFFMIFMFGSHRSCPNGLVTSNMAPAHSHATSVAVYPALLEQVFGQIFRTSIWAGAVMPLIIVEKAE